VKSPPPFPTYFPNPNEQEPEEMVMPVVGEDPTLIHIK